MITDVRSVKMQNFEASVGGIKMREPSRADRRINVSRIRCSASPIRSRFVRGGQVTLILGNDEPEFTAANRLRSSRG
ncbi:hypothetical protein [Methylobacterium longum]|uniref:Uncharacterized protein n=1 Tax=Methylobacterium longum TaxID=767694 RepID=A0ABT8AS34_9HYPH|nr:hypothetical protein [Methylobacterium longum]MDN3572336.1 hypothetical protein [Methylobacterium longum]GJE09519.1 hypothetical protein FOHLNKBM_0543 [Methylobacterium longum]